MGKTVNKKLLGSNEKKKVSKNEIRKKIVDGRETSSALKKEECKY